MSIRLPRFAALLLVALAAGGSTLAQPAAESTPRDRMIVSTAWLADHLSDPDLVLLHIGPKAGYATAHIPGAQRTQTWRDTTSEVSGFSEMEVNNLLLEALAEPDLRAIVSKHGITSRSRVILYFSDAQYTNVTRIFYALRQAGVDGRTSILEGGLKAWVREGRPTSSDAPAVTPSAPDRLPMTQVFVDAAFVQAHAGRPGYALVDSREPAVFNGVPGANKAAPEQPLGHLPGAVNIPNEQVFDGTGTLRPADELRDVFARAGVRPGDTLIGYCYTGQRTTAVLFAAETLGYQTLVYDGSAEDWANRKLPFTTKK